MGLRGWAIESRKWTRPAHMDLDLELGRVGNLSTWPAYCPVYGQEALSGQRTCQRPVHHAGNSPFVDGAVVQLRVGGRTAGRGAGPQVEPEATAAPAPNARASE